MAIGERIRWFRRAQKMTQKELGIKMGFSEQNADMRVGQYESEQRKPKPDKVKALAQVFGIASESISVPDIDNYIGLMHTLFTLEDRYGLTITMLDGEICIKQDINHPNYDITLTNDLEAWYMAKSKLTSGSILTAEYNKWRYNYPKERIAEGKKAIGGMKAKVKSTGVIEDK